MTTVFSLIIRGDPKQAAFTWPFLLAVLSVPILGVLLKYSISFADILHLLSKCLSACCTAWYRHGTALPEKCKWYGQIAHAGVQREAKWVHHEKKCNNEFRK
jgi:hypothetical protein